MNRKDLRLAIERRLGVTAPSGDPKLGPDSIHEAINTALASISSDRQFEWLLTSSAGTIATVTGQMTLPTDCVDIKDLTILQTDGSYLRARQGPFEDVIPTRVGSTPQWCRFGSVIQANPIPTTGALTTRLYYWKSEPTLDADDQSPLMPSQFHECIILLACRDLAIRKSDGGLMQMFAQLANAELDKLAKRPGTVGKRSVREVAYDVSSIEQFATWS